MTFQDILDQVGARLNFAGGLTAATRTRLLGYLANRHREVVSKVPKLRNVYGAPILTTVAGRQQYSLSPSIKKLLHLYDTTNQRELYPVDAGLIRLVNPGGAVINFGLPIRYADIGYIAYQQPMPSANMLWAVSSANTDTVTVSVEYIRTGGYPGTANVALTGTTAVQIGTDADIQTLTKFYLSNTATGFVTLHAANATGTTISTLGRGQTYARFRGILLDPTPSANITFTLDYQRTVPDPLIDSDDEPLIDEDWQWILVLGVLMDECTKNENAQGYLEFKDAYEKGVNDFISDMMNADDWIVIPIRGIVPKPYPLKL